MFGCAHTYFYRLLTIRVFRIEKTKSQINIGTKWTYDLLDHFFLDERTNEKCALSVILLSIFGWSTFDLKGYFTLKWSNFLPHPVSEFWAEIHFLSFHNSIVRTIIDSVSSQETSFYPSRNFIEFKWRLLYTWFVRR